jgi:hypothetical protein
MRPAALEIDLLERRVAMLSAACEMVVREQPKV